MKIISIVGARPQFIKASDRIVGILIDESV
jgi:UDP-N-acetylglucosamine 2-epimerase